MARNRIGADTRPITVDAILTGIHQPGDSHFALLRAFLDDSVLHRCEAAAAEHGYRAHAFGDFVLIERSNAAAAASKPSATLANA